MPEYLVIDCSVAAKWVLPEPGSTPATRLLEQYESGTISLIAPDLLLTEFASLLAKRFRRKEVSSLQAHEAFSLLQQCAPHLLDTSSRLHSAFSLSLQLQLSLWDCVYLAVAIEYDCPLITADRRLLKGAAARHSSIRMLN